jgi:hypothetical protein
MPKPWIEEARRRLLDLQQGPGVWGYRARLTPAVEASSLAGLALLATDANPADKGRVAALATARWLASIRRPDGSLGVTAALPEPGWATPFAMLLWASVEGFEAERSAALGWLVRLRGTTANRTKDDPMGHDATIVGWPWVAHTHSWVEPTALALLAMSREGQADHRRVREGVRLIVDRAIPGGGWNLGNPVVFGTPLRPLPAPTGLALLALRQFSVGLHAREASAEFRVGWVETQLRGNAGSRPSLPELKVIEPAVAYLRTALAGTLAPASLGWGLLGLRAWGLEPLEASGWLASAFDRIASRELHPAELALLLLAAGPRSLDLLGLSTRHTEAVRHE